MNVMADPTVEFLKKLADESQWEIRRGIPVFEPHKRGDDVVTIRDLEEIAENSNDLLKENGVPGRLTDIHTIRPRANGKGMEPVPEAKLLGFQLNYRVGVYGPKQKPCLLADWYLYPEHASKADKSPHRSVEYQHGAKLIRGTAVMMNDPWLDMGVVVFGSGSDKITCYSMGSSMNEENKTTDTPEEEKLFEKMRAYMCRKYGLDESWPKAGEKKPEVATPEKKTEEDTSKKAVTPMQTPAQIKVYESQIAALAGQIEGLKLERDQERCKAMLASGLVGYSLTSEEQTRELAKLCKTPDAERAERIAELQKIYSDRKVPSGKIEVYQGHVEPGSIANHENNPHAEPWYHQEALTLVYNNPGKYSYLEACDIVQAKKK